MRTIRGKLIVGVVPGVVLLISALSAGLYIYMSDVLTSQQDATLINRTRVVIGRLHISEEHPGQIASPDTDYGEFARNNRPSCFEIFTSAGTPVVRSALLGTTDLALLQSKDDAPVFANVRFPNGRPGRAVCVSFTPTGDSTGSDAHEPAAAVKKYTIVLAKDSGPVLDLTLVLLVSLVAMVVIMAVGIIVLMSLALRRGLQPLERISRQAATRSPDDSPDLFPTDHMPGELLPICDRLNDLLGRLYHALQRQRRFTTDAAHELRTPIAEIRSVAEVAGTWADLPTARASLVDIQEVTRKMETIVNNLLAMARCDLAKQTLDIRPVEVNGLIEKVWQNVAPRANERSVGMQLDLASECAVYTDPVMLESILINLFGNSAEYAREGSTIACTTSVSEGALKLEIANDVNRVSNDDLTHFFEPFWRKDASASDDRHCGLGLTLAKAYADALKAPLVLKMIGPDRIGFSLRLPARPSRQAEKILPAVEASTVNAVIAPARS